MSTNPNPQTGYEVGQPPPKKSNWLKWVLGCGCGCMLIIAITVGVFALLGRSFFKEIDAAIEREKAKEAEQDTDSK